MRLPRDWHARHLASTLLEDFIAQDQFGIVVQPDPDRGRNQGYRIRLFFLRLPNPEAAIARVAQRVSEGGHDVPEAVIRRRFDAGWSNFVELHQNLVDEWVLYDNSGNEPKLLKEISQG